MAAKKFSLKDNPIFESTAIPVKKDREKHPLNAVYSSRDTTKRKVSNEPSVFMDKIIEWSAKKISNKVLYLGMVALIAISSFYIHSWWRDILRMDYLLSLTPPVIEARLFIPEETEYVQIAEKLPPEEALPEKLPPRLEEKMLEEKIPPALPRRLEDERWLLSAIIFDGANSHALINHRIVRKGDTLQEDVKVIEITQDSVILARGEETFTLRLD
jgi:hypothetical protein